MSDSEKDARKEYEEKVKGAIALNVKAVPVFENIYGSYRDSRRTIKGAENRAMTLGQLQNIWEQVKERCKNEIWKSTKKEDNGKRLTPDEVTLYDVNKYIILPLTVHRKCSYVEMVAQDQQQPQWFVSHWWGETVKGFLASLQQHADDHNLDESTTYWVCAYANNQWNVELGDTLADSPFSKAIKKAEGTVSILDKEGEVFRRIWCGYELYLSLLNKEERDLKEERDSEENYKWCVYTEAPGFREIQTSAVGLTEGSAPNDNEYYTKWRREKHFPRKLLENALGIDIESAEASVEADKHKILKSIGHDNFQKLNSTLKSHFAAAGLRMMLEDDNKKMWKKFLKAISEGEATELNLDFSDCKQFTERKQDALRGHIDWKSLKHIKMNLSNYRLKANDGVVIGDDRTKKFVNKWLSKDKIAELNLGYNKIGNDGAKAIAKALKSNKVLKKLSLRENNIGNDGAKAIAKALESNSTLKELTLSQNKFEYDGAKALGEALEKNKSLTKLYLLGNDLSRAGRDEIRRAWKSRSDNLYMKLE